MMTLANWLFYAPTKILFGPGTVDKTGPEARGLGAKRVLVVTDKGVAAAGILARVTASLREAGIEHAVFDEVETNPSVTTVEKGHGALAALGGDLVVGLGGGSSMDVAKAVGLLATNAGPLVAYEGANLFPNTPYPTIAIPTTAGTGAEVTQSAVITDRSRSYKASIRGAGLLPKVALLDPQLVTSLPSAVVAATGMDALSHAVESYLSVAASPLTEALSLEAIRVIARRLRGFAANPADEESAAEMLFAAMLAGLAFANARLTAVHAIAHTLGGHFDVPHGVACAMLLAPLMRFVLPSAPAKLAAVAAAMGEDVAGLSEGERAERAVAAVARLGQDIGIPARLRDCGVTAERVPRLAEDAEASGIHLNTPRPMGRDDLRALIESVL